MDNYASFISEALEKTKCRECVPSWEEIQMLMNRQEMLCTVHHPGPGSCQLYISSHTTANEVWEHLSVFSLYGLSHSQALQILACVFVQIMKDALDSEPQQPQTFFQTVFSSAFHQVVRRMQEKLGLQDSKNTFALYEQNALWEQPVAGNSLIADVLTRYERDLWFSRFKKQAVPKICHKSKLFVKSSMPLMQRQTVYYNAIHDL